MWAISLRNIWSTTMEIYIYLRLATLHKKMLSDFSIPLSVREGYEIQLFSWEKHPICNHDNEFNYLEWTGC